MTRHYTWPLRPTLTALLMLVAMAGAAGDKAEADDDNCAGVEQLREQLAEQPRAAPAAPVGDFPLEDARTAYQRGDYGYAFRLLKALEVKPAGNPDAALFDVVPQDDAEAARRLSLVFGSRGDPTLGEGLNNAVITQLRTQYLELSRRENLWSTRYGSNHLAAVNLRNQMAEIRKSIANELARIVHERHCERAPSASGSPP